VFVPLSHTNAVGTVFCIERISNERVLETQIMAISGR
jgi:hypothetical protein